MNLDELEEVLFGDEVSAEEVAVAIALIALGVFLALVLWRLARTVFGRLDPPADQVLTFVVRLAQLVIVTFFLAWALGILGANGAWLSLLLGVCLIVAVLVARPFLEGLAGFLALSARSAFKVGDEIEVSDLLGRIEQITARSTVLRTRDGRRIHIPNRDMLNETVTVFTVGGERRSSIDVGVAFGTDLDELDHVVEEALGRVPAVTRIGSIRVRNLSDGINLSIRFWHPSPIEGENEAVDNVNRAIYGAFTDADITFAPSATYADYARGAYPPVAEEEPGDRGGGSPDTSVNSMSRRTS